MQTVPFPSNPLSVIVEKEGPAVLKKDRFPLRYGTFSEIRTPEFEFRFNLNGEIKTIRGLSPEWPHPAEQLKRTDGNDWVYYTVGDQGGDRGLISWMGEYYLPCLSYPSNPVWEINYFANPAIMKGFAAWSQLYADLYSGRDRLHARARVLVDRIFENNDNVLHQRALQLKEIVGGPVSVLPPDTRHVDYEVIPMMVADGCLYHCRFCFVKTENAFQARTKENIRRQILEMKTYYGRNLKNYRSLFLGNHDGLAAGEELIVYTATEAYREFDFESHGQSPAMLFMFGSVDSLLKTDSRFFDKLDSLPYHSCINIGFESVHDDTLKLVGKPLESAKVRDAFRKMMHVNDTFASIEITGNFLLGEQLPLEHEDQLCMLLADASIPDSRHGTIYLSPLQNNPKKRELLPRVYAIQQQSRLPVFIYLIQRL